MLSISVNVMFVGGAQAKIEDEPGMSNPPNYIDIELTYYCFADEKAEYTNFFLIYYSQVNLLSDYLKLSEM